MATPVPQLSLAVEKWLIEHGYTPGDYIRVALDQPLQASDLTIIRNGPETKPKKLLWGLLTTHPRRLVIGEIFFESQPRQATPDQWVIEAYGRDFATELEQLSQDMAKEFGVQITLRWISDEPRRERFWTDFAA